MCTSLPLLGFIRIAPPPHYADRPLPRRERLIGSPLPHVDFMFRPRGFSPPRRFAPVAAPGVLQPDRSWGLLCFRLHTPPAGKPAADYGDPPPSTIHTPRRIPLDSSRTASLRPLPSCRYRRPSATRAVLTPARTSSRDLMLRLGRARAPPGLWAKRCRCRGRPRPPQHRSQPAPAKADTDSD